MGDEEDAFAFLFESPHNLHQFIDFLRSKDSCGLIKNQDVIIPVQHLEDFHTLLHTYRDITDQRIRINAQAVFFTKIHYLFARGIFAQKAMAGILYAQNNVVKHSEALHQLEMLVDHSNPQCVRIVGVVDFHLTAILFDNTFFRLVQAEQYAHQCGFASTILAQKGMDFALAKLQGNVIICFDAGKFLGDVQHFDHILICQTVARPFPNSQFLTLYYIEKFTNAQENLNKKCNFSLLFSVLLRGLHKNPLAPKGYEGMDSVKLSISPGNQQSRW